MVEVWDRDLDVECHHEVALLGDDPANTPKETMAVRTLNHCEDYILLKKIR